MDSHSSASLIVSVRCEIEIWTARGSIAPKIQVRAVYCKSTWSDQWTGNDLSCSRRIFQWAIDITIDPQMEYTNLWLLRPALCESDTMNKV